MRTLLVLAIAMLSVSLSATAEAQHPDLRLPQADYSNRLPLAPPSIVQPPPQPPRSAEIGLQLAPGYVGGRVSVPLQ